ncbi:hypothetical protein [Andreprevotia chitinilytica]|uniref:hypothetical protein n=1 Tax=Andreprevotia chitinilytica TaxID=396808 RepID=UPI0005588727|nr:hypothetical protein [Andreprevotia chitinilytica]
MGVVRKRGGRFLSALMLVYLSGALPLASAADQSLSSVEYQGQRVPLAQTYRDFREYKDAPHNLTDKAIQQIEHLVRQARFGPEFSGIADLSAALDHLTFPGYGSFYANQLGARLDPQLEFVYVEIPGRHLNRYIALERQSNQHLRVVDDFIAADMPEIIRVHRKRGVLVYETSNGAKIDPLRK